MISKIPSRTNLQYAGFNLFSTLYHVALYFYTTCIMFSHIYMYIWAWAIIRLVFRIAHVSYLQIYNEIIQDLLIPSAKQRPLDVRHHPKHGSFVPGLTENIVDNYGEVQKLLKFGSMTRSVAATNMNNESSRSHCIFTVPST